MKRAGISQAELARRIQCKDSALTVMFRPRTKQSRLVPAIHRELGRPAPSTITAHDEVLRRINTRWPSLSQLLYERIHKGPLLEDVRSIGERLVGDVEGLDLVAAVVDVLAKRQRIARRRHARIRSAATRT